MGLGYSTYNHLLFDLASVANDFKSGFEVPESKLRFVLCPGRVIDLDEGTLPLGYIPVEVPRLTIQCGGRGVRSMTEDDSDACVIRGGGKRTGAHPTSSATDTTTSSSAAGAGADGMGSSWNANPERSYKPSIEGILGGGADSVAQIYVYGDTAYEVTLKGLTFDNSVSPDEKRLYEEYVAAGYAVEDDDGGLSFGTEVGGGAGTIELEHDASVPSNDSLSSSSSSSTSNGDLSSIEPPPPPSEIPTFGVEGKGEVDEEEGESAGGWSSALSFETDVKEEAITAEDDQSNMSIVFPDEENQSNVSIVFPDEDNQSNVSIVFPDEDYESNVDDTYQSDVPPPPPQKRSLQGSSAGPKPAHRFASVAVHGKGYGDDAGPRLITIEDCKFINHRGYAVLVSPGIQMPVMPTAPVYKFANQQQPDKEGAAVPAMDLQSSGQLSSYGESGAGGGGKVDGRQRRRWLNLLDDGGKYIPPHGSVAYYDRDAGKNYLNGRRVMISGTEFVNNVASGNIVAGLVTSAYSLTITNCLFQKNAAKSMVYVYNDDALVDDTVFSQNTVEVSTVILSSPKAKESNPPSTTTTSSTTATTSNGELVMPMHIVERSCFLSSNVGMSNVLVTDAESAGFGQRHNHAAGTMFTWASTCEGGVAEENGDDCLETGNCDGTCVGFTSAECLASRVAGGVYDMYSKNAASNRRGREWVALFFLVVWQYF